MFSDIARVALNAIIPAVITGLIVYVKAIRSRYKALDEAVRALSHDTLFRYCRYILPNKTISEEEFENLEYLYNSYHNLGMNGTGDKLYKECISKPLQK